MTHIDIPCSVSLRERARALAVSEEALALYRTCDVVDLHIDSFIWTRLFGYRLNSRHEQGWLGRHIYGHVDFPRIFEAELASACWVITTNPIGSRKRRADALLRNVEHLAGLLSADARIQLVQNFTEYSAARSSGRHAATLAIQGGNALSHQHTRNLVTSGRILLVTLMHLTSSHLGATSSPFRGPGDAGLSRDGQELIQLLNATQTFVDLAHISPRGFAAAVEAHDSSQPLLVSHTGVNAVHRCWRNIDDAQIRAVANTGGIIGIMFHGPFLAPRGAAAAHVIEHVAHVIDLVGEEHVSIGSDFDGSISPPQDLRSCLDLPKLVQLMLDRGWSSDRIRKIMGGNFLRAFRQLRP